MHKIVIHLVFFLLSFALHAQIPFSTVYTSGQEGHKTYRIPAIIQNGRGSLLAFAEGRVKGSNDFGDINIVLKRSDDGGKTWSALSTLVDFKDLQAGNPTPILDQTDPRFPNGRIFLFYNTGNNHEGEVRRGRGLREVWYITSADGGNVWSEPVNITLQVHKPNQPNVNPAYHFKEDWRHYANGPGHGMQFISGKFKGRMVVPANHSQSELGDHGVDYFAHAFYSDDHGKTFQLTESISIPGSNESTAAQISKNGLMLNIRNQKADIHARMVAKSYQGGASWDTTYFDHQLPDPICQGSLLSIPQKNDSFVLAFSNAADAQNRDHLTLRISKDEGLTWPIALPIDDSSLNGDSPKDFTAYSDLVLLDSNHIGILYERKDYSQIVFKNIQWENRK